MRSLVSASALRPAAVLSSCHPNLATPAVLRRNYATQNHSSAAASKRRSVTPFNDDGHVPWADLSAAEKTARATQQTFNFGFIVVGVLLTVGQLLHCS